MATSLNHPHLFLYIVFAVTQLLVAVGTHRRLVFFRRACEAQVCLGRGRIGDGRSGRSLSIARHLLDKQTEAGVRIVQRRQGVRKVAPSILEELNEVRREERGTVVGGTAVGWMWHVETVVLGLERCGARNDEVRFVVDIDNFGTARH